MTMKPRMRRLRNTTSAVNRQTSTTALQVIIDIFVFIQRDWTFYRLIIDYFRNLELKEKNSILDRDLNQSVQLYIVEYQYIKLETQVQVLVQDRIFLFELFNLSF